MRDYGYSEEGHQGSLSDFGLWKRVLRFSAPYKAGLIAAVFISFIITASTLTLPHLVQTAIDSYITVEHLERSLRMAGLSRIALQYGLLVVAVFFYNVYPDPDSGMGRTVCYAHGETTTFHHHS